MQVCSGFPLVCLPGGVIYCLGSAGNPVAFLADKEPGESVIRPSFRGPSYLTLTLKVCDGVYAHKDISEGGKEHKDITSLLRIGKILKIGDDAFEDLDEASYGLLYGSSSNSSETNAKLPQVPKRE
ncbi:Transcription elongation factor spt6 [Ancistrocladus abbreviatus]